MKTSGLFGPLPGQPPGLAFIALDRFVLVRDDCRTSSRPRPCPGFERMPALWAGHQPPAIVMVGILVVFHPGSL
jgi:hypothetical protein